MRTLRTFFIRKKIRHQLSERTSDYESILEKDMNEAPISTLINNLNATRPFLRQIETLPKMLKFKLAKK